MLINRTGVNENKKFQRCRGQKMGNGKAQTKKCKVLACDSSWALCF